MDEFLLYSPAWTTDANDSSRSTWDGNVMCNASGLFSEPLQPFGGQKNRSVCMFPWSTTLGNEAAENPNHHMVDETSEVMINSYLKSSQQNFHNRNSIPTLMNNDNHDKKFSVSDVIDDSWRTRLFESTVTDKALPISSCTESNESELYAFPQSLRDANSITSVPTLWPSSFSSISSIMGLGKLQYFGFGIGSNDNLTGRTSIGNGTELLHLDTVSLASTQLQDSNEHKYSSFSAGKQLHLSTSILPPQKEQSGLHLPSLPSVSQSSLNKATTGYQTISSSGIHPQPNAAYGNSGNGTARPRVRARRGQATDPHSIAERLRREKIAERMKNLQELVPNSNKSDKASMLDEIIDYVKFLQLQVKVLSMSRLGAAGAVVPLLTVNQTEGSGNLLLSSTFGQDGADLSDSGDNLAFEQDVLKLMETNITNAMQYLQHKGLCLMPIALAAVIPSQKVRSVTMPPERKSTDIPNSRSSYNYVERESNEDEANV